MIVVWLLTGLFCFGFAIFPWFMLQQQAGQIPTDVGALVLGAWSLFPAGLGAYCINISLRQTRLSGTNGLIHRKTSLFGWHRNEEIRFDRAYLAKHQQRRRHRIDERLALFLRSGPKKLLLASELNCARVVELFDWIQSVAGVKCIDIRNRSPVGI